MRRSRRTRGPTPTASRRLEGKQLEYTWTLTLAGRYVDFWALTERALDFAFARPLGRQGAKAQIARRLSHARRFSRRTRGAARAQAPRRRPQSCRTARPKCSPPRSRRPRSAATSTPFSLDAIRIYKPRPEVYGLVTEHFKLAPADVVFVSSNRWDVMERSASAPSGSIEQTCRRNTGHRPSGARRPQRAHDDGSLMPPR